MDQLITSLRRDDKCTPGKKKLVVSQLALACTLAITSQANAATYDTWTYYDNPTTALDWSNMDAPGTVDGNYVNYSGFVY